MAYADRTHHSMSPTDAALAHFIVSEALKLGYTISVWDGEAWAIKQGDIAELIWDGMASGDDEMLSIWHGKGDNGAFLGKLWLVYGNGPGELVADYTLPGGTCKDLSAWAHFTDAMDSFADRMSKQ